ncbi:MAG: plastocyanin/azurin family copper-binding protein [Phycisphaerales bacterium]
MIALVPAVLSTALSATIDVRIEDFTFIPTDININVGDTVRFTNQDFIPHTATSQTAPGSLVPSGLFDSGDLEFGQQYSFTFTTPGTVSYYCVPHGSSMQGSITVVPPPACPADLNGDGSVNTADLTLFLGAFGQAGPNLPADYNDDGFVNVLDLTVLLGQFGCSN